MIDLKLRGKIALVTGAGQGVGRRIAIDLAAQGCKIGVNDFFVQRAEAVAAEINGAGHTALALQADVGDETQVAEMFGRLREVFGPIDVLVNNAGVLPAARESGGTRPFFADTTVQDQLAVVALNVHGAMHCCREALQDMRERRVGRLINIVSEAGRVGEAGLAVYSGAKAAIVGFSMALAREYGPLGITSNCIALGAVAHEGIRTGPLSADPPPEAAEIRKRMFKAYPAAQGLGRLGIPEDVSVAVLFLASHQAAYITGQSLGVSGGFHMQ